MIKPFRGETYGKWILAGEHSVLRGLPAIAFPLLSRRLKFAFEPGESPLQIELSGEHGRELQLLFWGVLGKALDELKLHLDKIKGLVRIESGLPVGAGLGASAALCSAVGRWCESQGYIQTESVYDFSRGLEDLFHGESSGVDVAVSLSGKGIKFVRGQDRQTIECAWKPRLYLSYSGQRGITSECVAKVKQLLIDDPETGSRLDQQMKKAVELCEVSLKSDELSGQPVLVEAISLARDCFFKWGLITGGLADHVRALDTAGALAVKPTGSGGGGYALSLWDREPPPNLGLIPV